MCATVICSLCTLHSFVCSDIGASGIRIEKLLNYLDISRCVIGFAAPRANILIQFPGIRSCSAGVANGCALINALQMSAENAGRAKCTIRYLWVGDYGSKVTGVSY